jgi:outer membrane protein assembly factor BamB
MRVSRRAATTCWGVALVFASAQLAVAQQRPRSASALAEIRPYEVGWTANLDTSSPDAVLLVADSSRLIVVSPRGPVVARDAGDGHVLWTWEVELTPAAPPVTGDGLVFIVTTSWIYALDARSGHVVWRVLTPASQMSPAWSPGWLVMSSGGAIAAIRTADGSRVWQRDFGAHVGAVTIDGPRVYASIADRRLVAMNLVSGASAWETSLDVVPGELLAANNRLYFGAADGNFYCYGQALGEYVWGSPERVGVIGRPVTDGKRVYFAGFDNSVRARDAGNGNLRWRFDSQSRPWGALYLEAGHLVVPVVSGEFYLCQLADGGPAGLLAPLKATADEGIRLDAAAASDGQRLFRVTASLGGRALTMYRPARRTITPVASLPGKPMALRTPGRPPERR